MLARRLFLHFLILLSIVLAATSSFTSFWRWMRGTCNFVPDITKALKKALPKDVRGQDGGLEFVFKAFGSWEESRKNGELYPLVLVITGSTGVGKNYVSRKISEQVFGETNSGDCSMNINGNSYHYDDTYETNITTMRMHLQADVYNHIYECNEKALIIVDEFQKITPGVLSVLDPAIDPERKYISDPNGRGRVSTKDCIFLFLTDAAGDILKNLVVSYGERENIPSKVLIETVFAEINKEQERLQIVRKYLNNIIPFLPLEPLHILEVINLQFDEIKADGIKNGYWRDFVIHPGLMAYFAGIPDGNHCVNYVKITDNKGDTKKFSVHGAREIVRRHQGGVKYLWEATQELISEKPRKQDVLLVKHLDDANYNIIKGKDFNKKKSKTGKYVYMQWCRLDTKEAQEQFGNLTNLQKELDMLRLYKMKIYPNNENVCESETSQGSCRGMQTSFIDEDKEFELYDEIYKLFNILMTQTFCQFAYLEPLEC